MDGRAPFVGVRDAEAMSGVDSGAASTIRQSANSVTINVDGASRGNPGPSGIRAWQNIWQCERELSVR